MGAEGGFRCRQDLLPSGDAGAKRFIDVAESLCGGGALFGVWRGVPNAREDAAGLGLARGGVVTGFEAEEGVLEGDVSIGRVKFDGFAELFAGGFGVAGFEQRVGEVFTDVRAGG
jgi:hypothetical protein